MRARTWFRTMGLVTGLGLLAACKGAAVITSTDTQRYIPQSNALFVGNGQLVLIGDAATPEERAALAQVAAEGIADGAFGTKFRLTPSDQAERPSKNRVVVTVGSANSRALCDAPPSRGSSFAGTGITVSAAACNGDTRLSSTNGSITGLSGVDDPALKNFFAQIGSALFPGRNLDYQLRDQGEFDSF